LKTTVGGLETETQDKKNNVKLKLPWYLDIFSTVNDDGDITVLGGSTKLHKYLFQALRHASLFGSVFFQSASWKNCTSGGHFQSLPNRKYLCWDSEN
jgi:hypothetical protein